MKFSPYISLDIETTGLPKDRPQVLQIAGVIDDLRSPVDQLQTFNFYVDPGEQIYGNAYALALNTKILKLIADDTTMTDEKGTPVYDLGSAIAEWSSIIATFSEQCGGRITIAGKNVAGFDLPILGDNGFSTEGIRHRVLDPGPMYFADFGYVPRLDEINKMIGRLPVSHDALQDAYDVVYAIRHKVL